MLINGQYTIRLSVYDTGGNQANTEISAKVDRNLKVGNFSLTYTDLQIPMAGIPITVSRLYDSRDKRKGDFGIGWRLRVNSLRLQANRVLGSGWRVVQSGLSFFLSPEYEHKVSLTLADGRAGEFDSGGESFGFTIGAFPTVGQPCQLRSAPRHTWATAQP